MAILFLLSCTRHKPTFNGSVLLFHGSGSSPNAVKALATIIEECGMDFEAVDSRTLNEMTEEDLGRFQLIVFPGGNYVEMGESLSRDTTQRLRKAIRGGVNYLGICAGGLLAGSAEGNSLNLTAGVRFDFYGVVNQGVHRSVVPIAFPDATELEQYWEDGPEFSGWGRVVAKYIDGTPAIVEEDFGDGFVILCGFHPEAPESWRKGMKFRTPVHDTHQFAKRLIDAAFQGKRLPHY